MLTAMDANGSGFEVEALLREADWIRSLARGLAHLPDGALDLEQETWLAALRARPATDRGLRPWLATVMRNAARANVRAEQHRSARERQSAREEALPSAQELAARAELQRVVVEELLALDEPYRSTILLCFFEGLAPGELARRQGLPSGTVRAWLSRGLEMLRRRMDERHGGDRSRWLAMLGVPATRGVPVGTALFTGLVMKKIAWVALAVCIAFVAWYGITRDRAPETEVGASSVPARLEAPSESRAQPPLESSRREAAAATLPTAAGARSIRVRFVDERTNEPVPALELALGDAPTSKRLATDSNGEIELTASPLARVVLDVAELAAGDDLIQTTKPPPASARVEITVPADAGTEPIVQRVAVGPTYRLDLVVPPGHVADELDATLRSADPRKAFDVARAIVRNGTPHWLRFRPTAYAVAGGPPWKLEVQTSDGLWSAAAEVDEREGIARKKVALALDARARLSGKLTSPSGDAIAREWVRLEREGATFESATNRPLMLNTRADGSFDFRALAPGKWTLSATVAGFETWRNDFVLAALETRTADVKLVAAEPSSLARIEGSIESKSGAYAGRVFVAIFPAGTHAGKDVKVEWSESDGRRRGRFAAADLKPGRYRVTARASGLLAVEPREIEVETGAELVRFVVRDDVETVAWHARAFADGRPLDAFRVTLEANGLVTSAGAKQGLAVLENLPRGTTCEFAVRADGFAPNYGEVVIDGGTSAENARRFDLRPGWGTDVTVVDTSDRPLEGVRVSFDGRFAATTDARGRARIALESVPQAVSVEYEGWRIAPGTSVDPQTGKFRTWEPFLRLVLER